MIHLIDNIWVFLFVLVVLGVLIYQYFQVLKVSRSRDDYGRVKVITRLVAAFILLLGISSIFADAIFEFLGLTKPQNYEVFTLTGFTILCIASYLIMNLQFKSEKKDQKIFDDEYEGSSRSSIHDYDLNINNSFNRKESLVEKGLEFLGLATLLRRLDIDINVSKPIQTSVDTDHKHENISIEIKNNYSFKAEENSTDSTETDYLSSISNDNEDTLSEIDIDKEQPDIDNLNTDFLDLDLYQ